MLLKKTTSSVLTLATAIMLVNALLTSTASAQEKTPGYNNRIPESIMTPNNLETRLGTFEYFDGIPTPETADAIYNHLDYIRGVETFLNGLPAASLEAIRRGQAGLGLKNSNQVLIFDDLMDSNSLFLTGNTDTVYVTAFLDLHRISGNGEIKPSFPERNGRHGVWAEPGSDLPCVSSYKLKRLSPPE